MRVLILTLGTRGDVQPFLPLARELHRRGHEAVVAAPQRFAALAAAHTVPFVALDDGPLRVLDAGSAVGDVADGGLRAKAALMRRLPEMFGRVLDDCWQAASGGADLIVHNGQVIAGQHVAEKLGVPAVLALPLPMYVPTREFPWPGQEFPDRLPRALNRATYAGMRAPALVFGRTVDRWRDTLGLPRRRDRHDPTRRPDGSPAPVLHAISPAVLPRPADWPGHRPGHRLLVRRAHRPGHRRSQRARAVAVGRAGTAGLRRVRQHGRPVPGRDHPHRPGCTRHCRAARHRGRRLGRPATVHLRPTRLRDRRGRPRSGVRTLRGDRAPRRRRDHRSRRPCRPPAGDLPVRRRPTVLGPPDATTRRRIRTNQPETPGPPALAVAIRHAAQDGGLAGTARRLGERIRAEDGVPPSPLMPWSRSLPQAGDVCRCTALYVTGYGRVHRAVALTDRPGAGCPVSAAVGRPGGTGTGCPGGRGGRPAAQADRVRGGLRGGGRR